jgi:hypothetical protein
LGTLSQSTLTDLLTQTVQHAVAVLPSVGETVSVDTKHTYAYVKENNPRVEIKHRYDPTRQPAGDPDCRLGVKRRHNQGEASQDASADKEYLWGYGTGIAVTQTPDKDALVFVTKQGTMGLPQVWCNWDQGGCKTRRRSKSSLARPYITRLMTFNRLT